MFQHKVVRYLLILVLASAASLAPATDITLHFGAGANVLTDGANNDIFYDGGGTPDAAAWNKVLTELTTDAALTNVIIEDGTYSFTSSLVTAVANKSVTFRGTTNTITDNVNITFTAAIAQPVVTIGVAVPTANTAATFNFLKITNQSTQALISTNQATTGNTFQTAITITGCTLSQTGANDIVGYNRANGDNTTVGTTATQFALTVTGGTYNGALSRSFFNGVTPGGNLANSHMRVSISNATFNLIGGAALFMPGRGGDDVGVTLTNNICRISAAAVAFGGLFHWVANNNTRFITNSTLTITDNEVYYAGPSSSTSDGAATGIAINATYGNTGSAANANNTINIERNYIETKVGAFGSGVPGIYLAFGFAGSTAAPIAGVSTFNEANVNIYNNVLVASGGTNVATVVGLSATSNQASNASAIKLVGGIKNTKIYHNTLVYDNGQKVNPGFHGFAGVTLNLPVNSLNVTSTDIKDNLFFNFAGSAVALGASQVGVYTDGVIGSTVQTDASSVVTATITPPVSGNNMIIGPITSTLIPTGLIFSGSASPVTGTDLSNFSEFNYTVGTYTGTGNGTFTLLTTPAASVGTLAPNAVAGTYTAICITAAANAGTFRVTDPNGVFLGTVNASVAGGTFFNQISFTVTDGTTDFLVNDQQTFTVAASVDSTYNNFDYASDWKTLNTGASSGAINTAESNPASAVGTAIGNVDITNAGRGVGGYDIGAYEISLVPVELSTFTIE